MLIPPPSSKGGVHTPIGLQVDITSRISITMPPFAFNSKEQRLALTYPTYPDFDGRKKSVLMDALMPPSTLCHVVFVFQVLFSSQASRYATLFFFLIFSSFDYLLSVPLFCLLHVLIRYNSRVNILFPHFSSRSLLIYSLSDATALHPPTFESCRVSILCRPKLYE